MQDKIAELNKKIDALQEKAADNAAIIDAKRAASKEQLDSEIAKAKGNVEEAKAKLDTKVDDAKTAAAAEVSRIHAKIDVAKQKIADKKEAIDRKRFEMYIDDVIAYAGSCIDVAIFAAEEAQLATLEAISAQIEFAEKYGE